MSMNSDGGSGFPEMKCAMYALEANATSAGGAVTVNIKPPDGERWRVICAQMFHDGAAARTLQWRWTAGSDYFDLLAATSTAASALNNLYMGATGSVPVGAPIICTPQAYITAVGGAGFLAGEKIYVQAVIERLQGLDNV